MNLPTPVFMADIARAMQTPPPAQQQAPTQPLSPGDRFPAVELDAKREAKNERDRLRRKAQRAAALKAAEMPTPKKKKAKKKKATAGLQYAPGAQFKPKKQAKRRRGRPPGAKNKPKVGLAVALVPAPGVLPRGRPAKVVAAIAPAIAMQTTDALAVFGSIVSTLVQHPPGVRNAVLTLLNSTFK